MSPKEKSQSKTPGRPIKKTVRNKSAVGQGVDLQLIKHSTVGDYIRCWIGVCGEGNPSTYVVHRFIGVAPEKDGDRWYVSSDSDITDAISRSDDPDAERLRNNRAVWLNEQAVGEGLLILQEDGTHVYAVDDVEPTTRKAFKDKVRKDWLSEKVGDRKAKDFDFGAVIGSVKYRNHPVAQCELAISGLFKRLSSEADTLFASPYETMLGPLKDRKQVELEWAKGVDLRDVTDMLSRYGLQGPGRAEVTPPEPGSAPPPVVLPAESAEQVVTLEKVITFLVNLTGKSQEDVSGAIQSLNSEPDESEQEE